MLWQVLGVQRAPSQWRRREHTGQALLARTCSAADPEPLGAVTAKIFAEVQFEKWCEIGGGRAPGAVPAGVEGRGHEGPTMLNQPTKSPKQQNSWKCKNLHTGARGRGLTSGVLWN